MMMNSQCIGFYSLVHCDCVCNRCSSGKRSGVNQMPSGRGHRHPHPCNRVHGWERGGRGGVEAAGGREGGGRWSPSWNADGHGPELLLMEPPQHRAPRCAAYVRLHSFPARPRPPLSMRLDGEQGPEGGAPAGLPGSRPQGRKPAEWPAPPSGPQPPAPGGASYLLARRRDAQRHPHPACPVGLGVTLVRQDRGSLGRGWTQADPDADVMASSFSPWPPSSPDGPRLLPPLLGGLPSTATKRSRRSGVWAQGPEPLPLPWLLPAPQKTRCGPSCLQTRHRAPRCSPFPRRYVFFNECARGQTDAFPLQPLQPAVTWARAGLSPRKGVAQISAHASEHGTKHVSGSKLP